MNILYILLYKPLIHQQKTWVSYISLYISFSYRIVVIAEDRLALAIIISPRTDSLTAPRSAL